MSEEIENPDNQNTKNIPTVSEESNSHGDIRINNAVVASIVRLAALEVDGIVTIGGEGFVDGIREIFRGRETDHGVIVTENEAGEYQIECRVVMRFGAELAHVAMQAQQNIQEQVKRMTMKEAAKVDIIIDGVRMDDDDDAAQYEDVAESTK